MMFDLNPAGVKRITLEIAQSLATKYRKASRMGRRFRGIKGSGNRPSSPRDWHGKDPAHWRGSSGSNDYSSRGSRSSTAVSGLSSRSVKRLWRRAEFVDDGHLGSRARQEQSVLSFLDP